MRKIKLILVVGIVLAANSVFGQDAKDDQSATTAAEAPGPHKLKLFSKPIWEENYPFGIGFLYGSNGKGFSLTQSFKRPEALGLFISEESYENAQLGLVVGCKPVEIASHVLLTTAIEWQYMVKIITADKHPTSETFIGTERMFVSLKIGPTFEVWRLRIGVYYNGGQSFFPSSHSELNDWRWLQQVSGTLRFDF